MGALMTYIESVYQDLRDINMYAKSSFDRYDDDQLKKLAVMVYRRYGEISGMQLRNAILSGYKINISPCWQLLYSLIDSEQSQGRCRVIKPNWSELDTLSQNELEREAKNIGLKVNEYLIRAYNVTESQYIEREKAKQLTLDGNDGW